MPAFKCLSVAILLEVTEQAFDRLLGGQPAWHVLFHPGGCPRDAVPLGWPATGRSIITITSANAGLVSPEKGPYCISKAGLVDGLAAIRRCGSADAGIHVHEIRPGLIRTDMTADVYERYSAQVETGRALGDPALGPAGRHRTAVSRRLPSAPYRSAPAISTTSAAACRFTGL